MMASSTSPTALQVRSILASISKCSELWGEIRVLTRSYQSMNTGIFHDASYSFETTLADGEHTITEFLEVPKHQGPSVYAAFNQGDNTSYAALQNVIESQKQLLSNLEDIKRQLARAYHDQFASSKSKSSTTNPESILDIGAIMSMRDLAQEHITSTSRSLKELTRRIEARDTPQPQPQARPRSQQQQPAPPLFQNPVSPTGTRGYRPEEAAPDMPPRPPPARPQRAPPVPQPQLQPQDLRPTSQTAYPAPSYQNLNPSHNPNPNSNPNFNSKPNPDPSSPTNNPNPPNPIALPCVGDKPGTYCIGAIRLQRDATLTVRDILRPSNTPSADPNAPLYCKYCLLQLGDDNFREAVMEGQRKGTVIAKQHITACKSVWDRKAMFKCLECTKEEADSEFRDVEDFKAHLKLH